MFLDGATRDIKGEDEAYKFASLNTLGGLLVFARFFDKKKGAFAKDPCFMVIALPSTGIPPYEVLPYSKIKTNSQLPRLGLLQYT
jgi:hypothetical protein